MTSSITINQDNEESQMKVNSLLLLVLLNMLISPVIAQERRVIPTPQDEVTQSDIVRAVRSPNPTPVLSSSPSDYKKYEILLLFEKNSSELSYGAMAALDELGQALNDELAIYDVVIEGHADRSGTYELNQWLSRARAESVRKYLMQRHGIVKNRLSSIGKGYDELFDVKNPTSKRNRRVSFVFINRD